MRFQPPMTTITACVAIVLLGVGACSTARATVDQNSAVTCETVKQSDETAKAQSAQPKIDKAEKLKQEPAGQVPAKKPKETPAIDPDVERILKLEEAAGARIGKLRVRFEYDENNTLLEDREWREGHITYKKPNRILIEFTDGGKESFRFDGRIFIDDRPQQKVRHIYPIRKPSEPAVDDLDIGNVPFPLPFGQKRDKVLKNFEVTYGGKKTLSPWQRPGRKSEVKDKTEYEHLILTPKPRNSLARDYKQMEFWIDPNSGLPKQIRMLDNSERILTVRFYDQQTNDKVAAPDKLFEEGPLPRNWDRFVDK